MQDNITCFSWTNTLTNAPISLALRNILMLAVNSCVEVNKTLNLINEDVVLERKGVRFKD